MKNVLYILSLFFGLGISIPLAQEVPGGIQTRSILLLNGTAHLGTGEMINRSAIVLENGKIVKVMNALTNTINNSDYDSVIDIKDKHVYPGFIAVNSTLGLVEIGAIRATEDFEEIGTYNPNVRAIIAYNTDSKITPTIRTNGVLLAQVTPRGGIVSGSSSVVHFDAWNWEDALIKEDIGIHLNWPKFMKSSGWWSTPEDTKKAKNYMEKTQEINTFFDEAVAYSKASNEGDKDLKLEAMKGLLTGEKTLFVNVSYIKEINDVINFKRKYKLKSVVIVGGYDSWMVTDRLKENNISVIIEHIHSLPNQTEDDIDLPYKLPKLLHDAGVPYCLQYYGSMEQMGTRNLPFVAGTAIAYGLSYEEGVASITLNAAKILGIEKELGSIEEGKNATLFVSEGDALDMKTSNVVIAFIDGRMINLDNHQSRNYNKYKRKYGLE